MIPIEIVSGLVLATMGTIVLFLAAGSYWERRLMTEARKREIEAEKQEKGERRTRSPSKVVWWVIYGIILFGLPVLLVVDGLAVRIGLLYSPYLSFSNPLDNYVQAAGVVLLALGLVILVASGRMISGHVYAKAREERRLITAGIYAYVRHPFYLSDILIAIGLILITLNYLALVLALAFWSQPVESDGRTKPALLTTIIATEEQELLEMFGKEYEDYMKRTGRLLPKIRR